MIRHFFTALSYIFHPFLMPLMGLYILFEAPSIPYNSFNRLDSLYFFPDQAKQVLYIVIGILTLLAPLLSLVIMYRNGMIKNFHLENKKERIIPFAIGGFYYLLAYIYVRYQLPEFLRHPALLAFLFGSVIIFLTVFVVNFSVKVSLHTTGIFGLCGGLIGYYQTQQLLENHDRMMIFLMLLIFVGGLVGAGRIYLKAHTLGETILGMFIGFVVMYVTVRFQIFI